MINKVIKSDGSIEPFDVLKLKKWWDWAEVLGADDKSIILKTVSKFQTDTVSTEELHSTFIKTCLELETEPYSRLAGRLYLGTVYKRCFGHHDNIPELNDFYNKMVISGYWEDMNYDEEELDYINDNILDHEIDKTYTHSQIKQMADKYCLKDTVNNVYYESPQFMFIRMAMTLAKDVVDFVEKMNMVEEYYTELAITQSLNFTTPDHVNLGTLNRGFASCCLFTSKDSASSISTGVYIADRMTCASAGIGHHMVSRSIGDAVKGGVIEHNGKLPYLRYLQASVKANTQTSRGGSATTYISCNDPEIYDLIKARSVTTPQEKRIGGLDFAFSHHKEFRRRVAVNEDWPLFSYYDYPDLYESMYKDDPFIFENKLKTYESKENKFKYVNARELLLAHLKEELETGRAYEFNIDESNRHTSFKETIWQSNLCVAPETLVKVSGMYNSNEINDYQIYKLEDKTVNIWNGNEWSKVTIKKTGSKQKLLKVVVLTIKNDEFKTLDYEVNTLDCTEYHKWYDLEGKEFRTKELKRFTELETFIDPVSGFLVEQVIVDIVDTNRHDDTYCFTEPKRNRGMFNGILTGNCNEVYQPTIAYDDVDQLFVETESGEISLCTLFAVNVNRLGLELNEDKKGFTKKSIERYKKVAYLGALKVDKVIDMMDYPFPQLAFTSKNRRNMASGVSGLAELMAMNKLKYSSQEGRNFIHMLLELHSYAIHFASLQLAKEKGVAGWINKTKYPDGWLPIDTYNKNVDTVVDNTLYLDWEGLREEIIKTGGLRFSSHIGHMPCESSSQNSGSPNGVYPIRAKVLIKGDAKKGAKFIAPNWERYGQHYELAWDIPSKSMTEVYAIIQKFTDQGISIDSWHDKDVNGKFSGEKMLDNFLYGSWLGIKGKYYTNSRNNGKIIDFGNNDCGGGACKM